MMIIRGIYLLLVRIVVMIVMGVLRGSTLVLAVVVALEALNRLDTAEEEVVVERINPQEEEEVEELLLQLIP